MIENTVTEFKREYTDDIKYAALAFANTDGGEILIGVEDDGVIRGVEEVDGTLLRITNLLRDAIRPDLTLFLSTRVESMQGKPVIVLTVQRGTARPYYLAGKGIRPEGVYVRQGASSVPASETAILKMIRETGGERYEDMRSLRQQLTFERTASVFARRGLAFGNAQMRTLNFIGADGMYTNLALLLSDQCVHSIKIAVFEGSQKTVFRDRKEISGSLLGQLEDTFSYLDQHNHLHAEFAGLDRLDRHDYPAEALREALLNAIVHRDYAVSGPTLISLFDDRMEILTLGGLVRGITYNDILLGVSMLRNEHLANVLYRLRLIEAYGTGLSKIRECYASCGRKPKIEVSDNAFKITLPNVNEAERAPSYGEPRAADASGRSEKILDLIRERGSVSRLEVEKALGVSQATAGVALRSLLSRQRIVAEGAGRTRRYRLPDAK